jgi:hypothetical protein
MQGAITLLWVVYNLYLVQILTQLGLSQELAVGLLVIENLLAMVVEPLMGSFSDRRQHQIGTRLPLISLGAVLAAGLFGVIPTVLVVGQGPLRWGLPLLLIAWATAMAVFRSPALSLLGRYALGTQLPQAGQHSHPGGRVVRSPRAISGPIHSGPRAVCGLYLGVGGAVASHPDSLVGGA